MTAVRQPVLYIEASASVPSPGNRWAQRVYGRLNRRLLAWFLVFSLLPVMIATSVGYGRTTAIITDIVERFLSAYARLEAQHVSDRMQERLQVLRAMTAGNVKLIAGVRHDPAAPATPATASGRAAAPPSELQRYLLHQRAVLRSFDALSLFTADGQLVVGTDSARPWGAPPTAKSSAAFSEFVNSDDDGRPQLLRLVVPILSPDTSVIGYLVGMVGRTSAATFLQLPISDTGGIDGLIFDTDHRPLVGSVPAASLDSRAIFLQKLLSQPTGAVERYYDGRSRQRIAAVSDIPQSTWRFVAEVSAEDALRPLRQLGWLSLLLAVLLLAALVVAAVYVAQEIVDPVRRLAVAAGRVAAGEMHVKLPVRGHDEVAELGHAFNEMTHSLDVAMQRVAEMHEREIERASQLASVGELASGLAHEIKNPVIGVTNGLDLVRRRIGNDATLAPIFDEMERQLGRVAVTVQDLLAFARPAPPQFGPVSANDLVERALRLIQPAAERAGVRLHLSNDPTAPHLHADEGMVHQALVNILMNAVQATPTGGEIHVTTQDGADQLTFEVSDNGRGIPADTLSDVFRPFFTTRHTGTGLGLSITRGIVERHGGTVSIESHVGLGTIVRLRFPMHGDGYLHAATHTATHADAFTHTGEPA